MLMMFLLLPYSNGFTQTLDQYPKVVEAIQLQTEATTHKAFNEILRELESNNKIDWEGRTKKVKEDLTNYPTKTEWAIERFQQDGVYNKNQVDIFYKLIVRKKTKAITLACVKRTGLNKKGLSERTSFGIARTLVHERSHSFCLKHPESQKRIVNMCDFPYISGDLAESILVTIYEKSDHPLPKPMCPALCNALQSLGMPHSCTS